MKLRLSFIAAALAVTTLACQPLQETPPLAHDDGPQKVQFPDIKAIAARSVTPAGALHQLVRKSSVSYSPDAGEYSDSVRTQFLYNEAGQIAGYQNFSFGQVVTSETQQQQIERMSAYGVLYEYKNNRPYRIYSKWYDSMVKPYRDLYSLTQFVYENESTTKPKFRREYNLSATGETTPTAEYELVYDQMGNLIESKDVKQYGIHQRYTYQNGNVIKNETVDPKPTTIPTTRYEYEYDRQINPTRNLFWNGNYDYTEFTANANNVIQKRLISGSPPVRPYITDYTLDYDSRGRIVSRSIVMNTGSGQWFYRYGK